MRLKLKMYVFCQVCHIFDQAFLYCLNKKTKSGKDDDVCVFIGDDDAYLFM